MKDIIHTKKGEILEKDEKKDILGLITNQDLDVISYCSRWILDYQDYKSIKGITKKKDIIDSLKDKQLINNLRRSYIGTPEEEAAKQKTIRKFYAINDNKRNRSHQKGTKNENKETS